MKEKNAEAVVAQSSEKAKKPRRKWLRRSLIIFGIILLILLIAVAAAIIWLGPIAEWYLEKNDKELISRRIEMDDLRLRLFDGTATADNIILYEADGTTPFATIDHLEAEMDVSAVMDGHIHLTRVHLTRPYLSVVQDGEIFNFDDMVNYIFEEYFSPEDEEESGDEWKITIENVTFEDGHLVYVDKEIDQCWDLSAMNLYAEEFFMDNKMSPIDAELIINNVAPVKGLLLFNYDTFEFDFQGTMEDFDLADTYKYWTPYLNITSVNGIAYADAHIVGDVDDIWAMDISGDFDIRDGVILGPDGSNLLSAKSITGNAKSINIEYESYIFNTLYINDYSTHFTLEKDGTSNFTGLFPEDTEVSIATTSESLGSDMYDVREEVRVTSNDEDITSDMVITIGDMSFTGGSVQYADYTLHRDFIYDISNLSIKSSNFDLDNSNSITIEANVPKQGSAIIRWDGSFNDFYNQSILAVLSNVDIKSFGPYMEYFTAFPVESGNLTFRSQNIITNGELNGVNQLGTYNFAVGKKDKSMDVDFKLPLRAGIYILTDRNDHIDVELPVSGNIESPEFSYRRAILKAIGNLLLKVVAAPFDWMSGDKQDAFRHINVSILEPGLSAEQYARLDKMAETLVEDEALAVRLTHSVNYKRATQQLADLNLKIGYYNSIQSDDERRLDMLDFSKIQEMKLSNSDVLIFADSMLTVKGIDHTTMTSHAKARALYGDMADKQLLHIMERRNQAVRDYISFQHPELREGAIVIDDIDYERLKNSSGKNRYNVTLIVDGEEVPINTDDDETNEEEILEDANTI